MGLSSWAPQADFLVAAAALDITLGDPSYRWHPVRLMGWSIEVAERWLRFAGADGRAGGCALLAALGAVWCGGTWGLHSGLAAVHAWAGAAFHVMLLYSLLAMGDLLRHCNQVDTAGDDVSEARRAAGRLVGRDPDRMDARACRRSSIESLAENLVDGFVSPVFWYLVLGMNGIVLFKLVSTLDSMVGYKNKRYLRFGWCAARSDDLLNWLPSRLTWLLISAAAFVTPDCSGRKALRLGWRLHAIVPGPNPGWSEAAMAGAIERRLVGPIWEGGRLVTEVWLGDPSDPTAGCSNDYRRARRLACAAAAMATLGAALLLVAAGMTVGP